jgi:UDP-glucose 4-epimerase
VARYLVTGGAGFIGSHLVEALIEAGHEVRVLDDFSNGRDENLGRLRDAVDVRRADIRDFEQVADAAAGADGIFHLAALGSVVRSFRAPDATFATNVGGARAVMRAAREVGVRRVVLASSSSVYGANGAGVRRETDAVAPLSPYAESKLAAERICLSDGAGGMPEAVCLRYFNVYGPRQDPASPYAAAIPRFITRLLRGEPLEVYGDGRQTRDFTYVADIVSGTIAAMTAPEAAGRVINLGAAKRTSVNRLISLIGELAGSRCEVHHAPSRPGEAKTSVADVTLARDLLGYEPRWTLAEGLRVTMAWHEERLGGRAVRARAAASARSNGSIAQAPVQPASPNGSTPPRGSALVTGGAGFIGSHLSELLLDAGWEVYALDDLSTGTLENVSHLVDRPRFHLVVDTVLSPSVVNELVHKCDVVYHLAAAVGVRLIVERPVHTLVTNVQGTEIVLDHCSRFGKRVLVASSSEVYGDHRRKRPLVESDRRIYGPTTTRRWAYADSKAMDEFLALAYHEERGLDCVIARLFNTAGPRQSGNYGMVVPRFVESALAGRALEVHGDGTQTRCFCHVSDTIRALRGLMEADELSGEIFNVGFPEPISILELARRVVELTESDSEIVRVAYEEIYGEGIEDMLHRVPSIEKIRRVLGWEPQFDLDRILHDVIASHGPPFPTRSPRAVRRPAVNAEGLSTKDAARTNTAQPRAASLPIARLRRPARSA